jgi:hypothetical protein
MKKRVIVYLIALYLLAGIGSIVLAEEKETEEKPPSVAQFWYFTVKPQMYMQFEAALKEHIAWHEKAEGKWGWNVFQIITGPRYGEYIIRSHNVNWEDFDANAKFFEKQVMMFRLKVLPLVDSVWSNIVVVDMESSHWPEEEGKITMVEVYQYYLKPTMVEQFNEAKKEMSAALKEANWGEHYAFSFTRSGGVVPSVSVVVPRENWADFAEPEVSFMDAITKVMTEEEAKELVKKYQEPIAKIKSFAVRYRPELSYKPNM